MLGWEFPPFLSGGLGIHCYYLTRELAKKGVEIDFFMPKTRETISVPWMNIIQVDLSGLKEIHGVYKTAVEKNGFINLGFFEAVEAYNNACSLLIKELSKKRKYDLLHGHDWIVMKTGINAKKELNIPLILSFHSTEYDRTANLFPYQFILEIEKEGAREADRIITVGKIVKKCLLEKFGANSDKIRVIYNAVDHKKFSKKASKKELGFPNEVKIVLFHGRLSVQKGPEFFLRAAKRVLEKEKKVRFIVSGKGDLLPRLAELSIELGIQDKVVFTGYTPDEQLPLMYAASDVYVLSSVSEPFGITVLEAMASGTPCIVSKTSGVSELIRNCLRVDFWDVDEMASKILSVIRNECLKKELEENGRKEVNGITWEKVASETLEVYEEVAKNG